MSLYANAEEFLDAGLRLIPLYPNINGKCGCSDPSCPAAGKHPLRSNWQNQRLIDSATLNEVWYDAYRCNGLGWALDQDHIVIDVDARNGGIESLEQLQADLGIDLFELCTAIAHTGGKGYHFYFRKLDSANLGWKMPEQYRGIDIKMFGGYVVIPGSLHASGEEYSWHSAAKSSFETMALLPESIAAMLSHARETHRTQMQSEGMGNVAEISEMLEYIRNEGAGLDYEMWLRIGMSIHHATAGGNDGLAAWDKWSQQSTKYSASDLERRWHSFGKRQTNVSTTGTLVYIAKQAGWEPGIDSDALSQEELTSIKAGWDRKVAERVSLPSIADDADIDLFAPPGLLGQINDYVYACSVFPNRNLALACSLSVITNVIGRKYYWPGRFSNIQPNLLVMCIAGSSVGKDSVLGAAHKLLTVVGLGPAVHGRIKSEKDLLDAMERNQYAMYFNDEFGHFLQRLNNSMKKGNASYLEGVIGTILEAFTKGDKHVLLDISRKKTINDDFELIIEKYTKAVKDGSSGDLDLFKAKIKRAKMLIEKFKDGFPNPFLSMFTTATPRTMELAFSGEATENGFLSRAMTFHEYETNPRPKLDFEGASVVPMGLAMRLKAVTFDRDDCPFGRVDSFDQVMVPLTIDNDAQVFVDRAIDYFFDLAETQKSSGLESLPRRALDGVVKVCIALAAETRQLTLPMARYAVKLIRSEMDKKIRRVNSTENMASHDKIEKLDGVASRILEVCSTATGETVAVIFRQVKNSKVTLENIQLVVDGMIENGYLEVIDSGRKYAGVQVFRYKSTGKQ